MGASSDSLTTAASDLMGQAGDFSWWQTVGGSLVVFVLLLLCLRLLTRWQRPANQHQAAVLEVWPLGPRREIQVVRLQDEVHFIYRHEGALVLLKRQEYATYLADQPAGKAAHPSGWRGRWLGRGVLSRLFPAGRNITRVADLRSEESGRA